MYDATTTGPGFAVRVAVTASATDGWALAP